MSVTASCVWKHSAATGGRGGSGRGGAAAGPFPDIPGTATGYATAQPGNYWNSAPSPLVAVGGTVLATAHRDGTASADSSWESLNTTKAAISSPAPGDSAVMATVMGKKASDAELDVTIRSTCMANNMTDTEQLTVVKVVSITPSKDTICKGDNSVTFTIVTQPVGHEDMVTRDQLDTSAPGDKTIVARCGSSTAQCQVKVVDVTFVVTDLWHFETFRDYTHYPHSMTIIAEGAPDNKGTFTWELKGTRGSAAAFLDTLLNTVTFSDNPNVFLGTRGHSYAANDVTVKLTYTVPAGNSSAIYERSLTVRTFELDVRSLTLIQEASGWTYETTMYFVDNVSKSWIAYGVQSNERFTEFENNISNLPGGEEWYWFPEQPTEAASTFIVDQLRVPFNFEPPPVKHTDSSAAVGIDKATQTWRYGNYAIGSGDTFIKGVHKVQRNRGYPTRTVTQ